MTNLDIAFKTDSADKETTINLDTLISTLTSIKGSMKELFGKRVSFDFKHTSISSFKISITINDSFDQEELFEHRNEKTYDEYLAVLENVINSGELPNIDIPYIISIKNLLKAISDESEDVEITLQNDDENFRKVFYVKNSKAKSGYVRLKQALSKSSSEIIERQGSIALLSATKRATHIGISYDGGETIGLTCNASDRIRADILAKILEIGDKVKFSAQLISNRKNAELLYIENITRPTSLFQE